MSPTVMAVVALGMLAGAGLALLVREFSPEHPRLSDAMSNLAPVPSTTRPGPALPAPAGTERLGAWAESTLTRLPGVSTPDVDLRLIGRTGRWFWAQKLTCVLIGLVIPSTAGILASLLGVGLPIAVPAGLGLIVAAVMWVVPDSYVRTQAARARSDFASAAVSYLRLVAIKRLGGRGVVESLTSAANLSDAWMFVRIREELALADMAGLTPWAALDRVADEIAVPELREIADIARLSEQGSAISDNLLARASSMRDRILSREHTAATAATTSLAVPLAVLLYVFVAALLYPMVIILLG